MDIMVMGRRAAAVMWHGRARLARWRCTAGSEKRTWGRGRSVAQAVKLPSLAAVRRTVQIEPSGRQLYILNNIM